MRSIAIAAALFLMACSAPIPKTALCNGSDCDARPDPCATNTPGCQGVAFCRSNAEGQSWRECPPGYENRGTYCWERLPRPELFRDCAFAGDQSNCARGQQCVSFADVNACTILDCQSDEECGEFNGRPNLCAPYAGRSTCLRGCEPTDVTSCIRPELACYPLGHGDPRGMCLPRCEADADCEYGEFCHQESGICSERPCNSNDQCPDASDACYVRFVDGQERKSCVPACSSAGCPAGYECSQQTNICERRLRGAYETCGRGIGDCAAGIDCLEMSDGTISTCIKEGCIEDSDCPSSEYGTPICQKGSFNGEPFAYCVLPCVPDASMTTCPPDTVCEYQIPELHAPQPPDVIFCGGEQR